MNNSRKYTSKKMEWQRPSRFPNELTADPKVLKKSLKILENRYLKNKGLCNGNAAEECVSMSLSLLSSVSVANGSGLCRRHSRRRDRAIGREVQGPSSSAVAVGRAASCGVQGGWGAEEKASKLS